MTKQKSVYSIALLSLILFSGCTNNNVDQAKQQGTYTPLNTGTTTNGISTKVASGVSFKDVTADFWGYANIQWAIDNQVVDGYPDGTFKPNQNVEQAEFLAMLIRGFKPSEFTPASGSGNWSAPYIEYASKKGWKVVAPTSLGGYASPVYLTRGMVAQYMAGASGKNYSVNDSIQYLLDMGLSEGKTGKSVDGFKKDDQVTRTEAITFIQRYRFHSGQLLASPAVEEKYLNIWRPIQFDPRGTRYGDNPFGVTISFITSVADRSNDGAPAYEYGAPFTVNFSLINVTEPTATLTTPISFVFQVTNAKGEEVWVGKLPPLASKINGNKGGQQILFQWDQKDSNGNQVPAGEYYLNLKSPTTMDYTAEGKNGTQTSNLWDKSRTPGVPGAKFIIQVANFKPESINKMIQLAHNTQMYENPSESAKTYGQIAPQYVKAVQKLGNWYKIESGWMHGYAWIQVDDKQTRMLNVNTVNQEMSLTANTLVYQGPDQNTKVLGTLAPQTIQAIERTGNWYYIGTTWGAGWILMLPANGDSATRNVTKELTKPGVYTFKGLEDPGEPRVVIESMNLSYDGKGNIYAGGTLRLLDSDYEKSTVLLNFVFYDKDGNRIGAGGANALNVGIGETSTQWSSLRSAVNPYDIASINTQATIVQADDNITPQGPTS